MKRAIALSVAAHLAAGWLVVHRVHREPPADEPPRTVEISGDTFDRRSEQQATAQESNPGPVDKPEEGIGEAPKPKPRSTQGTSAQQTAPEPAKYGAVGERGAFDLVPTFARAFVQAASADPIWATAPLGDAGSLDLAFYIDEHGALLGTGTTGAGSEALERGVKRTIALIGGRTFYANGAETRIRVRAKIVSDEVHDGLHGEVFAIGASGSSAFFALAIGRRIDVEITPVR